MRAHTQEFKEQIKELGREIDSRITFDDNVITSEELFSVSPIINGEILKSAMKELDFESSVQVPLYTILKYEFGLKVKDKYEYINYGDFIVYSSEYNEDTKSYQYTCYDVMLFSMKEYTSLQNGIFPMTVRDYITNLCLDCGLVFKNITDTFANYDKVIQSDLYANLGYTYRDIFDELSAVTASTICSDSNNLIEVRYITEINDTIDEEYLKDINVKFGEKYGPVNSIVLSRGAESDNIYLRDEESINTNGLCEIKIVDNQIMNNNNRSDYLPAILEKLNGLEYYLNDFTSTGILYYELCDRYNVKIGEKTYNCVLFNDEVKISQGLTEDIYTVRPEKTTTDYTKSDKTDRKINQAYLIVDKQNKTIESVVSQTEGQNQKISQLTQTVNEIKSEISEVADITISADGYGYVSLVNINESEPIYLKIHPGSNQDISYLYPSDNLYPNDILYPQGRTLKFTNTTTNETVDYELPDDLLYYDENNYDEFILDYDAKTCEVNKKVGCNEDGSKYLLETPQTISYPYPKINLHAGDYSITMIGYDSSYIFARLMVQNIYTNQFATKMELNSSITQTATEINLEVSKKVGNDEVISKINQTSETITIQANKVNIGGVINSINNNTTTTIDGNKITTGSITTNQIKSGAITADKVSSDIITTNNFSAQNINADKITSGTINGTNVNITNLNASNITSGSFSASRVSGGTLTGANIDVYSGTGFFRYLTSQSIHPYVSALNMAYGTGNGLSFRSGSYRTDLGSPLGHLSIGDAQLLLESYSGSGRNMYVAGPSISLVTNSGTRNSTGDYAGSIYVYASESVSLNARNGAVYAGNGTSGSNSRVAVDSSGPSSRNLKENITDFEDYDSALRLLKNMKIYNYNYKYKLSDKKDQYGFIIDDLLEDKDAQRFLYFKDDKAIPNEEGYFDYQRADEDPDNENIINFKRYDEEMLVKYLLITNKALLKRIEELEEKINGKN